MNTATSAPAGGSFPEAGEIYLVSIGDDFTRIGKKMPVLADLRQPVHPTYRETVRKSALGEGKFIRQADGKGQYGHVVVKLKPNEKGKGIKIIDDIEDGTIPKQFIKSSIFGIRKGCDNGVVAGHPVVDVIVRIVDGSFHEADSSDLAFKMAGIFAFKDAMQQAAPFIFDSTTGIEIPGEDMVAKIRPAVVVSREDPDGSSEPVICVPLTMRNHGSPYEVSLGKLPFLDGESWAYVRGAAAFDRKKLTHLLGRVSFAQLQKIKAALRYALDL
jgi:mRNA-degrading endonuclease toxin of MazEF toxin-antitoxin module